MVDDERSELEARLGTCGCPRISGEPLSAPRCAVLVDPCEREGPILVSMPHDLRCPYGGRATYGEFCSDANRISLYRDYRL